MSNRRSCAIISSQAFSLINFRGPLISDLVASGVAVHALAPDYDDDIRKKVIALGAQPWDYRMVRTGMNPVRDCVDTFRLIGLLRQLRPDVTLGYFIKPVIFGTLAAWIAGVPKRVAMIEGLGSIFTASSGSDRLQSRMLRWMVAHLYRIALMRSHKVIFLNDDDLSEFVNSQIVEKSKAFNLGGIGVALEAWAVSRPITAPVTFLLAARLIREKGIVEYAEAARLVKMRHPETRFLLLGGLDPNPHCLQASEVKSWVSQGLLEWPGHVDVHPWMAQASVYVLPSYYREGVPRSTQEAMAMGKAVVTTDAPGCRETVIDGVNGFLVPVRDAKALAQALLRFVENPSLIESMGIESRRLAEIRFDAKTVNARLMEILEVK